MLTLVLQYPYSEQQGWLGGQTSQLTLEDLKQLTFLTINKTKEGLCQSMGISIIHTGRVKKELVLTPGSLCLHKCMIVIDCLKKRMIVTPFFSLYFL